MYCCAVIVLNIITSCYNPPNNVTSFIFRIVFNLYKVFSNISLQSFLVHFFMFLVLLRKLDQYDNVDDFTKFVFNNTNLPNLWPILQGFMSIVHDMKCSSIL